MTLYPDGYGRAEVTLEQMVAKHGAKMHPEFSRRFFAWVASEGGRMGIGGGWRSTQPAKPGFAPDGKSFHQDQLFASGFVGYAAVDLVHRQPGQIHRSPTWAETADADVYGLHTFIKTPTPEPWHMQCIEMRGYTTWILVGRPDPTPFLLPGDTPPPSPDPDDEDDMRPTITTWQGEDPGYTITIGYDLARGGWTWASVRGDSVEALIKSGAAIDGRHSPLPQALKSDPRTVRVA